MRPLVAFALLAGFACLSADSLQSQEKKDAPPSKAKGFLPSSYGKIGLTDDQKQEIYKVQAKYKEEVKKLEDKIAEVRIEERKEINKVLTPDQRKKLAEVITGETSKEEPKKPADKN